MCRRVVVRSGVPARKLSSVHGRFTEQSLVRKTIGRSRPQETSRSSMKTLQKVRRLSSVSIGLRRLTGSDIIRSSCAKRIARPIFIQPWRTCPSRAAARQHDLVANEVSFRVAKLTGKIDDSKEIGCLHEMQVDTIAAGHCLLQNDCPGTLRIQVSSPSSWAL